MTKLKHATKPSHNTYVNWSIAILFILVIILGYSVYLNNWSKEMVDSSLAENNFDLMIKISELQECINNDVKPCELKGFKPQN